VDALAKLSEKLAELVAEHDAWQEVDDELRLLQIEVEDNVDRLKSTWPSIQRTAQNLYGDGSQTWAKLLQRLAERIEKSLQNKASATVIRLFDDYRSGAVRRFRHVDDDLLKLCQELQQADAPLDLLFRTLQ
jgi:hypothetical protein